MVLVLLSASEKWEKSCYLSTKKILQLLQNCIGPTIRIGWESWCLPYAGFFFPKHSLVGKQGTWVTLISVWFVSKFLYNLDSDIRLNKMAYNKDISNLERASLHVIVYILRSAGFTTEIFTIFVSYLVNFQTNSNFSFQNILKFCSLTYFT